MGASESRHRDASVQHDKQPAIKKHNVTSSPAVEKDVRVFSSIMSASDPRSMPIKQSDFVVHATLPTTMSMMTTTTKTASATTVAAAKDKGAFATARNKLVELLQRQQKPEFTAIAVALQNPHSKIEDINRLCDAVKRKAEADAVATQQTGHVSRMEERFPELVKKVRAGGGITPAMAARVDKHIESIATQGLLQYAMFEEICKSPIPTTGSAARARKRGPTMYPRSQARVTSNQQSGQQCPRHGASHGHQEGERHRRASAMFGQKLYQANSEASKKPLSAIVKFSGEDLMKLLAQADSGESTSVPAPPMHAETPVLHVESKEEDVQTMATADVATALLAQSIDRTPQPMRSASAPDVTPPARMESLLLPEHDKQRESAYGAAILGAAAISAGSRIPPPVPALPRAFPTTGAIASDADVMTQTMSNGGGSNGFSNLIYVGWGALFSAALTLIFRFLYDVLPPEHHRVLDRLLEGIRILAMGALIAGFIASCITGTVPAYLVSLVLGAFAGALAAYLTNQLYDVLKWCAVSVRNWWRRRQERQRVAVEEKKRAAAELELAEQRRIAQVQREHKDRHRAHSADPNSAYMEVGLCSICYDSKATVAVTHDYKDGLHQDQRYAHLSFCRPCIDNWIAQKMAERPHDAEVDVPCPVCQVKIQTVETVPERKTGLECDHCIQIGTCTFGFCTRRVDVAQSIKHVVHDEWHVTFDVCHEHALRPNGIDREVAQIRCS